MPEDQVVVVGGGITGLSSALTLQDENPGISCVLLEAADRLGGKLRTETVSGVQVEAGADSFLARTPEAIDLCRDVGLMQELVSPAIFGGLVWAGGKAMRIPRGTEMGVPTSVRSIVSAEALTAGGKVRALGDLVIPGRLRGNDISVGELIRRRFGRQVLDRLVDPILAGTRAGHPNSISLRAGLPHIDRVARRHRSLIVGLGSPPDGAVGVPPFFAPRAGMERVVDAIVERASGVQIEVSSPVSNITRGKRGGYMVHTREGRRYETTAVVLAVPAPSAAQILRGLNDSAASGLARITHASVAVITLLFRSGTLAFPPSSSGFLVPSSERRLLSAGTWWSTKWPHTCPPEIDAVRCFVGRAGRDGALDRSDDELIEAATAEVGEFLGVAAQPVGGKVTRWEEAIPQYEVGHFGRIARIEGALDSDAGIVLAGADYRGSGIPDCVRQGRTAARRVAAWL